MRGENSEAKSNVIISYCSHSKKKEKKSKLKLFIRLVLNRAYGGLIYTGTVLEWNTIHQRETFHTEFDGSHQYRLFASAKVSCFFFCRLLVFTDVA